MESKKRILIVDDDEALLFILRETFSKLGEGYQVVSSRSGREAMEQLAREPCDVMVTDLKMCDVDGIQLTETARSSSPGMPVIWLTAYGCEGVQEEVARLGVRRCINKPVGTSDIGHRAGGAGSAGECSRIREVCVREARNVACYSDVERLTRQESPWTRTLARQTDSTRRVRCLNGQKERM